VARLPHFVRNNGAAGNFRNACRYHRRVCVNKWTGERVGLSPSRVNSISCLNPIPGRSRRIYTGQCQDRAIAQHATEGQYY
jgi:hypothetical protein